MKMRLTTDDPQGNFPTMVNYVFSKDGLAYIRSDGESDEPVLLTDWANRQCIQHKCISKSHSVDTFKEIDERICDCAFADPKCPVFLAYTFACQAVHMRDRCKAYEDAEEQNLLIKLPCKVGDTLYCLERYCDGGIRDCGTTYKKCTDCPDYELCIYEREMRDECQIISNSKNIGKTVFLTREAAEAALNADGRHQGCYESDTIKWGEE